ncbi:MAG: twin-arginine translocase subunit TatC [Pseudolysinimonas sp.]|uniref:twin-arginine translocase subunit TatC n=1 Tax=Pseudolysinimonas sp. TaxID=2680009 RepID=UPI003266732D
MAASRRRNPEGRMSLGEHLVELRKRLTWAGLAILVGTIGGFFVAEYVWDALREPITKIAADHDAIINYDSITGAFDVRIQIAIVLGILASSPVWLYQIFAFLVPGLSRKEKGYTFGFFFTAVPLFFAGCFAGWWVFPHIIEVLATFVPPEDASYYNAKYYLDFIIKLVLATGIAFVLPVFLVLLNFVGVLSGVTILKGWRWAILAITLFTAIATPAADVLSMFLLAIPMVVLYFTAVGITVSRDRIIARRATASVEA